MSSRLKSKKLRIVIALVLILIIISVAAFGYYNYRIQEGKQLGADISRPPLVTSPFSCHEYTKSHGWRTVDCLSEEYVRAHVPHPQAHISPLAEGDGAGVLGINPGRPSPLLPVTFAQVNVNVLFIPPPFFFFSSEVDSSSGLGGFSIQLNTNTFTGRSGHNYWYQFVHQNFTPLPGANSNACSGSLCFTDVFGIWQNDITVACNNPALKCGNPQGYFCTCVFVTPEALSGSYSTNILTYFIPPTPGGGTYGSVGSILITPNSVYAVVAPDLYGLSALKWQSVSGTILGAGGGSQAQFITPTVVQTTLTAKYGNSGTQLDMILPNTYTDTTTAESNNLSYPSGNPPMTYNSDGTVTVQTLSFI